MAYEAKQYAQRNRQGSDWFSHDSNATKPPVQAPAEPVTAANETTPAVVEDGADKSSNEAVTVTAAADVPPAQSARAQMIRPKSDSNEWFVVWYHTYCVVVCFSLIQTVFQESFDQFS